MSRDAMLLFDWAVQASMRIFIMNLNSINWNRTSSSLGMYCNLHSLSADCAV